MIFRPLVLVFSCFLLTTCQNSRESRHENLRNQAIHIQKKASQWLVQQQQNDGAWHSETHGILKEGVAYTAFIIDALRELPDDVISAEQLQEALLFLFNQTDESGAVGQKGAYVVEYPVYATAYTLKNWKELPISLDTTLSPILSSYLIGQQFNEARGINPDHPAYGAWGFGEQNLPQGEVGHIDLSHSRRVLQALRSAGLPNAHPSWQQAAIFLNRLQNQDGGFCSSTYTLGANKADDKSHNCVSYATATADGLLALLALPEADSSAILLAANWLLANEDWTRPSGITPNRAGNWDKVLFYYHLSVRAQAYEKMLQLGFLDNSQEWQQALITMLGEKQDSKGSFSNPWGAPNKEDDPLLATALALRAVKAALRTL